MAVLGLLREQDMHGYELKKRLADVFGVSSAVSFGSLYPALARLEAAGAVHVLATPEPGAEAAPAVPRESRRRKVYAITPRGAEMFVELLMHAEGGMEDEKSFNVRLAFASYLPQEARLGLLERRRAVLGEHLALLAARARAKREDRYMRILMERQRDELARDMTWLNQLIDEERASAGDGPPGAKPAGAKPAGADPASANPAIVPQGLDNPGPLAMPQTATNPGPGAEATDGLLEGRPRRLAPLASASQLLRPRPVPGPPREGEPPAG
ncbi:MAG TPA: PadR family transcriptional regulator [Acidimicrobiales bacterium]|nr:PadR family transcriptional regulator [Acidimicrobiales bacterium]